MNTLNSLLSPLLPQEFFENYWGQNSLRIEGDAEKFSEIITWQELNQLLSHAPLRHPQVRLLKNGKEVSPETYIRFAPTQFQTAPLKQSVVPQAIQDQLREGATLVLNGLHSMLPKVQKLAVELERVLGDIVRINGYLGWNGARGFSNHWDDHDVIIMQIFGEKEWYLYGQTRSYPLALDSMAGAEPKEAHWQGRLTAGDLLYLPRGYWHAAESVEGPTFHLTIGVSRKTGVDFLHWLADQLVSKEVVRKDLPRIEWAHQTAIDETEVALIQHLMGLVEEEEGLLAKYLNSDTASRRPLNASSLPFAAHGAITSSTRLVSNLARKLIVETGPDGTIVVSGAGKSLTLPEFALPIIKQIDEGREFCPQDTKALLGDTPQEAINGTLFNMIEIAWLKTV